VFISEMSLDMSSGTLNPIIPYNTITYCSDRETHTHW